MLLGQELKFKNKLCNFKRVPFSVTSKGEAKGFAKGEARGSYHKSLDIAKKMLLKGMDDDSIMELTGLTHEQLHQLKS